MTSSFIQRVKKIRSWFKAYKAKQYCIWCGTYEHIEFHHVGEKKGKIADIVRRVTSIEMLKKELEQTIPLCSKHHRMFEEMIKNES